MLGRLKNPWLIAALAVLLLPPGLVVVVNQAVDAHHAAAIRLPVLAELPPGTQTCRPPLAPELSASLAQIVPGAESAPAVSARVEVLFLADQSARAAPGLLSDPREMEEEDYQRRVEVLDFLERGLLGSPRDLVHAAFILQHGNCPDHYLLANQLAGLALDGGYEDARWIYAATLDRYLVNTGQPQKYGTQYHWVDGRMALYPVDPQTSDEQRRQYDVPPLAEAQARAQGLGGTAAPVVRILESWWLTLLGVGFALLGTVVAAVGPRRGTRVIRVSLVAAVLLHIAGAVGHWVQVREIARDPMQPSGAPVAFYVLIGLALVALVALVVWAAVRPARSGPRREPGAR